ncbi:hypothetical protein PV729_45310 [Streptomyces europaeiscabiei]|uniref:Uncharacterized protein n=1 Tax=Streptomyces europaeiscabiei TaxID=146819 RepID=A0ABU4NVM9_9ACTN|nr:hypothetical protein [Streptomyces europaeiscabiei]MDX2757849.1 hypothetical protein [Streptomyces europaeiscabiei]MDX3549732.1 hypothetical protein [Streptomyces europaeiscabiei]MDX3558794.1 hypothetical protein [Streptomyces europaeiscabiei]MDX3707073.1 hypothetical protein [Streptomyces europaeiscabiei]
MILSWVLKECGKPDCFRQVKASVEFCCAKCAAAAEGRYEVAQHSEGCERRHAERGEYGKEWRPVSGEEANG